MTPDVACWRSSSARNAFGIGGVVLAPIVYAFVKRELRDRGLV